MPSRQHITGFSINTIPGIRPADVVAGKKTTKGINAGGMRELATPLRKSPSAPNRNRQVSGFILAPPLRCSWKALVRQTVRTGRCQDSFFRYEN